MKFQKGCHMGSTFAKVSESNISKWNKVGGDGTYTNKGSSDGSTFMHMIAEEAKNTKPPQMLQK